MKKGTNFEKIIEFAPDAMVVVNPHGIIEYVNLQTEKIFSHKRQDLIGQKIEILVPDRFTKNHEKFRNSYFISPHVRPMGAGIKLYGKRSDGSEFPIEISLSPIEKEGLVAAAIRDISEKVRLNERFENLLESAPDAIVMVNKNGIIELVNLQTEKLFGFQRDELMGQFIEVLIPNRVKDKHLKNRDNFFTNPHAHLMGSGMKLFGKRKDGTEFPIEVNLSPIESEGLIAASIRDVTDKFLNDYLINKTKQLEDFAYITSHNLRSPVSNLTSLLNFYKTEKTKEGKELLFNKFELTVDKLRDTLNNLMEVLIIQQGTNNVKSSINFFSIYNKVISNLEFYINECKADIIADFSEAPVIEYSKIYLESIIQNLLSNALKYSSPERKPIIFIKTSIVDGRIRLTVKDNGLGIDLKKYGSKIFGLNQIFHKHPDAKGIGLFITKAQVDSMGGQIFVESEVDKGTTFTIIF